MILLTLQNKFKKILLPGVIFLLIAALSIYLIFSTPFTFDYAAYFFPFWNDVLNGVDPYLYKENMYPPLFLFLAYLYAVHPVLPKVIFGLSHVFILFMFLLLMLKGILVSIRKKYLFFALALHPHFILFGSYLAVADLLVSLLFAIAYFISILKTERKVLSGASAGFFFAASVFIKYYPVVLFPYLIRRRGREFALSFTIVFFVCALIVYFISFYFFSWNVFGSYATARQYIATGLSLVRWADDLVVTFEIFNRFNIFFFGMTVSVFSGFLLYRSGVPEEIQMVILLLVFFLFFPSGHIQYFSLPLYLLFFNLLKQKSFNFRTNSAVLFMISWISLLSIYYVILFERDRPSISSSFVEVFYFLNKETNIALLLHLIFICNFAFFQYFQALRTRNCLGHPRYP